MRTEVTSANAAPECGRRLPPLTSIWLPWRMLRGITRYSQDPIWTGTRHGTPGRWETTVLMLGLLPVPGHTRCSLISSWPRCLSLLISKANFNYVAARNACEGLLVPSRCACSNAPLWTVLFAKCLPCSPQSPWGPQESLGGRWAHVIFKTSHPNKSGESN